MIRPEVSGWADVARLLGASPAAERAAMWRARLTMAASLAHGLGSLPDGAQLASRGGRGADGRVLLWVVGARESTEGRLARAGLLAEVICSLWRPAREHGLELVLCGPEMRSWRIEPNNQPAGNQATGQPPLPLTRAVCGTLHSVLGGDGAATLGGRTPDAAVCFNSGVGTLLAPLVSPWLPTLAALLSTGAPILLTCYSAHEASGEAALLPMLGAHTLLPSALNPLAHPLPLSILEPRLDDSQAESIAREAAAGEEESAMGGGDGGGGGAAPAADAFTRVEVSNRFLRCVRGDVTRSSAATEAWLRKAEALLTASAQLFAFKPGNAAGWIASLRTGTGTGSPGTSTQMDSPGAATQIGAGAAGTPIDYPVSQMETRAANAELLSRASEDGRVALRLCSLGAREALQGVLRTVGPLLAEGDTGGGGNGCGGDTDGVGRNGWAGDTVGKGHSCGGGTCGERAGLSYGGAPAAAELALHACRALLRLGAAAAQWEALHREPDEEETELICGSGEGVGGWSGEERKLTGGRAAVGEGNAGVAWEEGCHVLRGAAGGGAWRGGGIGAAAGDGEVCVSAGGGAGCVAHVVFAGDYVNSRSRPCLAAPVVRRLAHGESLRAVASRGPWLRTDRGDWVLRDHPGLGALVRLWGDTAREGEGMDE